MTKNNPASRLILFMIDFLGAFSSAFSSFFALLFNHKKPWVPISVSAVLLWALIEKLTVFNAKIARVSHVGNDCRA
jgi:hypothetical protein